MTEQMVPSLDFEAMRRAIEGSDYEALVSFYADDAQLRMVNKESTPSSPTVLRGRGEISEMLRDVCGRAMTHHVENEVLSADRIAGRHDRPPDQHRGLGRVGRHVGSGWGAGSGARGWRRALPPVRPANGRSPGFFAGPPGERRRGMSVENNKDTFRRYVDEVWKDQNLDIADEIFAEKYLSHQSDGTVLERGPGDVKKFVTEYRSAFSDIENTVEDMIGEDDRVVNRWTLRVTHTGEFRGIPATNKRITITGIGIFRFSEEGKVIESWDSLDQLGMLKQLGAV